MRALEHEMITCESIDEKRQCKDDYEDCDWDKDDKTCSTVCAAVDDKSRCEGRAMAMPHAHGPDPDGRLIPPFSGRRTGEVRGRPTTF